MESYRKLIHEWLDRNQHRGIQFLQKVVREDSTQGNEAPAQAIVVEKLREMGLTIDIWEPGGNKLTEHSYFYSPRTEFTGSPNVVGIMKGTGNGRSIILNGHIDVVPKGDPLQWKDDPYSGKVVGNKMFGRGTTDMKGGNTALLLAMEAIKESGIRLKGDVIFESVIEEESGGSGTLATVLKGYKADAALIPEPTNMKIFPKQQGSMWFRLIVKGKSAHGGTRYEGVSAIEKAMVVVEHVLELEKERNSLMKEDPFYKGIPIPIPINIGAISGGEWPSSVADLVKLEGRMGVAPDESLEDAKHELDDWLTKLPEKDPWFRNHPVELEWYGARWVPGSIDDKHPLMNYLSLNYKKIMGTDPIIEASPWGTDGGLLTQAGDTPSVVFGPGITGMAHQANEYIDLNRMFETAEIIALTLIDWCEIDETKEDES